MGKKKKGGGGSPGQPTPNWDEDWPPKPIPQPPKLAKIRPKPHDQSVNAQRRPERSSSPTHSYSFINDYYN